jgi:hypothetical protein
VAARSQILDSAIGYGGSVAIHQNVWVSRGRLSIEPIEHITAVRHGGVLLAARLHLGSTFGPSVTEASGAVDGCFDRRHG